MDLELTDEQKALVATARRFLERECRPSLVRAVEGREDGFSPELWRRLAQLGWLGLLLLPEEGGAGMGPLELFLLCREMGRVLCPGPFISTAAVVVPLLARAATPAVKASLLPRVVESSLLVALAYQEDPHSYGPEAVTACARRQGGGYVLEGVKPFVEVAGAADMFLVAARDEEREGLSLFLVGARAPGVSIRPHRTMARDHQCKVFLEGVWVPGDHLLGTPGQGWALLVPALYTAVVGLCGYMVGAAAKAHEMATSYAKERVQFGRPIGAFQVVQHYLAHTITEVVAAETVGLYAAWALQEGLPPEELEAAVAKAKLAAGEAVAHATFVAAQIFGGLGYIEDADITLYLRRGKQWQLSMGSPRYWEERLAALALDR